MQVKETKKENLVKGYTVTVPASEMTKKIEAKLTEISKTVNLPGFRKGKAPMNVVRQRYSDAVMGEVLQQAVNDTTVKLMTEKSLRPANQPRIEIKSFEKNKDLEYDIEVEVLPEVKVGDL